MNDLQEINVEALMAQIQANQQKLQKTLAVSATTPSSESPVLTDLGSLQNERDIFHIHLTSHRRFLGPLVVLAKKIVRQLLTPSLERQSRYNTANNRVALHLWQQTATLESISQKLGEQIGGVRQELTEQIGGVRQELTEQIGGVRQELTEQIGGTHQELEVQIKRVHRELTEQIERRYHELAEQIGGVHEEQVASLQALRAQLVEQLAGVQHEQAWAFQELRERNSRAERRVRRFLHALKDGQKTDGQALESSLGNPLEAFKRHPMPHFDYFGFEERFRGSEEDIKKRQRVYIEYFREAEQVLDIGCGRGEFLELLKEAGIKARGVDLDLDMVLYCQEKGLDVIKEDAYVYLESLPDEALGGLFAAQVVEHLEPSCLIELVHLCQRKLRPGGILIFETPNPVCLTVFARSFYMDFTHIKPIHPEAMKFLFESAGFQDLQLKCSSPVEAGMRIPLLSGVSGDAKVAEEFNRGIERLNDLLYGFQDYAVVGRKSSH
jgi:2-polyprenyl-3-methyl-5-hydroxy-6-metoxy-1,4-benzoquinol methylase